VPRISSPSYEDGRYSRWWRCGGVPGRGGGGYGQVQWGRGGEEDTALVRAEDKTKRGSMLSEEGEDESHIGKRGDGAVSNVDE
jgi:hypothetical protein